MAHPSRARSRAELEAENAALHRQIIELQDKGDYEMRKGESLMRNVIETRADLADPAFVEDILKQAEEEKDKMQHKIQDLEWRLEDERRRGARDYGSGEQLRAVQRELDTVRREKRDLERKKNELQERLDNPLPNERASKLEREIEFLRQDKWKLDERLKEEKRNSEEWRHKYEQATHSLAHPRPNPVEDDLRRRNGILNQDIATLNQQIEDLRRERGIFQMKVRQVEEEMDAKLHSQGLRYDELHQAYQREKRDKENLKKRLDDIGQVSQVQALKDRIAKLQKEVIDLSEAKGKIKSDFENSQCKLEIEEQRTKDFGVKVEEMAHQMRSMEHEKERAETELQVALHEKKVIETKLQDKREIKEKYQPGRQQIPHDDLEKENQKLRNTLKGYQDRLSSAKDLGPLTAKVERLEEERKELRNDCDKFREDNEQLQKQIESFYRGQMSQGLSSVEAMLQENMKRMKRDKEYLQRKLEDAEREAEDLRGKRAEQKKRDDSKIQEKEKNFNMERERLEREIDGLKFENNKIKEELKLEQSKNTGIERDFDKMNPKPKKGVSFPQSILKKGSYTDKRERIDDESIPASTPTYEDLMKMKEEIGKLQSGLIDLEKDNRRREKENQRIEEY